uniref:G-protein coupled receptors family 1 profile domain-containing protein n=1 Tax=Cavia porcellus TaxID=10141 RepID=A0A286XRW8_CAVPO
MSCDRPALPNYKQQNVPSTCAQLLGHWIPNCLSHFGHGMEAHFCASYIIDHFTYDTSHILQISCKDTHDLEMTSFVSALVTLVITQILVILSYSYIIKTTPKFPSAQQRIKAFSACTSHMIV